MVFYRTYRPQRIADLDSDAVKKTLLAVLGADNNSKSKEDSIPHAFLFTGPKGLGKTSTARIVAKVVNCTQDKKKRKDGIEPCNECEQCISITKGTNVDVLEIDGASNRGIDEIRDLKEKLRLSPLSAKKKVYIIDEVHMLTTEAFNALLKTLEEPPSHVLFILCTTEQHKVPQTVVSRCFHVSFTRATDEELVNSFKRIAQGEKMEVLDDALVSIARLSDGSFRDGAKILEEMMVVSRIEKNGIITKELIEKQYKIVNIASNLSQFIGMLSAKNTKEALLFIGTLQEQGIDMKYFLERIISELHALLLAAAGVTVPSVQNGEKRMEISDLKQLLELFGKAYGELKYAVLPQLPVELAVIIWGEKIKEGVAVLPKSEEQPATVKVPHQAPRHTEQSSAVVKPVKEQPISKSDPASQDLWAQILAKVKPKNHSLAGVLRSCTLKSVDKKTLVIEAAYAFHKERLEQKEALAILESVCKDITGNSLSISVLLKN